MKIVLCTEVTAYKNIRTHSICRHTSPHPLRSVAGTCDLYRGSTKCGRSVAGPPHSLDQKLTFLHSYRSLLLCSIALNHRHPCLFVKPRTVRLEGRLAH